MENKTTPTIVATIYHWSCGCKTQKTGSTYYIKPCSKSCAVLKVVVQEAKERGNELIVRRDRGL